MALIPRTLQTPWFTSSDVVRQESAQFSWVVCLAAQSPSSSTSSSSPSSFSEDSDLCPLEWTLTSISCLPITHSITALEVYLQLLTEPFLDARLSLALTPAGQWVCWSLLVCLESRVWTLPITRSSTTLFPPLLPFWPFSHKPELYSVSREAKNCGELKILFRIHIFSSDRRSCSDDANPLF